MKSIPRHAGFVLRGPLPYAEPAGLRNVGELGVGGEPY